MKQTKVLSFINKSPNKDPEYALKGDSGFDLRAWINNEDGKISLKPFERKLIPTGLYFNIPEGTEIQVRPRSGMTLERGLTVLNSPSTIDENYTGEVGIIAINLSQNTIDIENGDKIAQAVLCPVYGSRQTSLVKIETIKKRTERGDNGYGHTGYK